MWSDSSDARDGEVRVTVGVDTHTEQHVAVALDQFGRRLGTRSVPTTPAGFAVLLAWARDFGEIEQIGIEGTGSYGVRVDALAPCAWSGRHRSRASPPP